ncbi:MAG TPA: sigma-70 family RNA polymerase sigma factor [Pseudomonadales bacterium]
MRERESAVPQLPAPDFAARREQLVLQYMGLPTSMAQQLHRSMRRVASLDDMIQDGMIGLIEAADQYDPNGGTKFITFAWYRVRGAILDGLQRASNNTRQNLRLRKRIEEASHQIQQETFAPATPSELARRLDVDVADIDRALIRADDMLPYDEHAAEDEPAVVVAGGQGPDVQAETQDQIERMFSCVRQLPRRDRMVFFMYFMERRTAKEIGAGMGLSKTRITQIKDGILHVIQSAMPEHRAAPLI